MGIGIVAIGVVVAIVVTALCARHLNDKVYAILVATIVGAFFFCTSLFIACQVDPTFAGEHTIVECVQCGNEMNGNDKFCSECGLELKDESTVQSAANKSAPATSFVPVAEPK